MARPPVAPAPPPTPQQPPLGPEDIPRLFECLQGALQPATQKQCEAVLLSLEQRPGYISCLLVIARPSRLLRLRAVLHQCVTMSSENTAGAAGDGF